MCVIIVKPKSVPPPDIPEWVVRTNNDGFGCAIVHGRPPVIRVVKSLLFDKVFREWKSAPPDSVAVLHLRAASAGAKSTKNCHPHKVSAFLYLFHNGHVSSVSRKPHESDTRALARHMRSLRVTTRDVAKEFLSRLFPHERFVLVSPAGADLIGHFVQEDGCFVNRSGVLKELPSIVAPGVSVYSWRDSVKCEYCNKAGSWKDICYDMMLRAYLCRDCYRELLDERIGVKGKK